MKRKMSWIGVVALVFAVGAIVGVTEGQTKMSEFPLVKAVPADAFITVAAKANSERAFLDAYWEHVFKAFEESGIVGDVWDLIMDLVPEDDLEEVEDLRERFGTLTSEVAWGDLFGKEMVYTGRLATHPSIGLISEGLLIGRMDKKGAAKNYAALSAIMEEIGKLIATKAGEGAISLKKQEKDGLKFVTLGPSEVPDVGITLGCGDDLILLSFGRTLILHEAVGLLRGTSEATGLSETARFKKAFSELPAAEDSLVFFDAEGLFSQLRGVLGALVSAETARAEAVAKAKAEAEAAAKAARAEEPESDEPSEEGKEGGKKSAVPKPVISETLTKLNMATRLLDDLSILDYSATVEWTEGYQTHTESVTRLRDGAKSKPLYGVLTGGKPLKEFAKYIPQEAENFSCSTGLNLSKLYAYVTGMVKEHTPEGEQTIVWLDAMQVETLGLHIDRDILQLFEGSLVSMSMGDDWVLMLRVVDQEKAAAQVASLVGRVKQAMGEGSGWMLTDVEVAGQKGFTQISHPLMSMMTGGLAPPVIGCAEGHLIIGSSGDTVAMCLNTSRGRHPNITENKRWKKEALVPESGSLDSISFTDQVNLAQESQAAIDLASMAIGMMAMFGTAEAPPEVRSIIGAIAPILVKLRPVVGELDFYQSSAAYGTFDGMQWRSRKVQNYKTSKPKPPAMEEPAGGEDEAEPAAVEAKAL